MDIKKFGFPRLFIRTCGNRPSGAELGRSILAPRARSVLSRLNSTLGYLISEEDIQIFEQVEKHLTYSKGIISLIYSVMKNKPLNENEQLNPYECFEEHPSVLSMFVVQSGQELKQGIEKLIDTAGQVKQRVIPPRENIEYLENYLEYFGACLSRAIYYHKIRSGGCL